MAQGYAGIPPGPLSAYMGVREANRQAGLEELQGVGVLQKLAAQSQAQQRANEYQTAIAQAKTPEEQAQIALKFGGPEAAMKHLDRQSQIGATKEATAGRLQQAKDALESRNLLMQQRIDSIRDENSRKVVADAWQRTYQQGQLDIQKQLADLKIASTVVGKPIPVPLQKQLTESAEIADATERFVSTFKDTYGGDTLTGNVKNIAGRYLGDPTGRSQWWQDYELHQSQIRNKLFGSALTASEIEAWNKSAINPRMEVNQIKDNLKRRRELEKKGIDRLMKGVAAGGYNKEQIEAFTGRSLGGTAPPETPTEKKRLKFDAQGNQVND